VLFIFPYHSQRNLTSKVVYRQAGCLKHFGYKAGKCVDLAIPAFKKSTSEGQSGIGCSATESLCCLDLIILKTCAQWDARAILRF